MSLDAGRAGVRPGEVIGILGGGQLGRMMAIPARQMGFGIAVLAPEGDAPAAGLADVAIRASFEDPDAARRLAQISSVLTYEFENIPYQTVRALEELLPVRPSSEILRLTQDRLLEHDLLHRLGVPTAPGLEVCSKAEARAALQQSGGPARLKTARGGYDGGGQWRVRTAEDLPDVLPDGGPPGAVSANAGPIAAGTIPAGTTAAGPIHRFLMEKEVEFDCEVSVILCRDLFGDIKFFPLFENHHASGILDWTRCPARVSPRAAARAFEIARAIAEAAGLVGTLTVECFVTGDEVRVNELAPRVHNSGHLTQDACSISQFEQHIRAICGLPLLQPVLLRPAVMRNLLGARDRRRVHVEGLADALADPDVRFHWYGKSSERARRKMGHLTALGDTAEEAFVRAGHACSLLRMV